MRRRGPENGSEPESDIAGMPIENPQSTTKYWKTSVDVVGSTVIWAMNAHIGIPCPLGRHASSSSRHNGLSRLGHRIRHGRSPTQSSYGRRMTRWRTVRLSCPRERPRDHQQGPTTTVPHGYLVKKDCCRIRVQWKISKEEISWRDSQPQRFERDTQQSGRT